MKTALRKLTVAWPLAILLLLPAVTRADTVNQAWVQRFSGPRNADDEAIAIAVDGSNNVIVTGYSIGSGSSYYATIKYSCAGLPLWTNLYSGSGNGDNYAQSIAVDRSNNVIVTGYATNGTNGYDYATIKYSSDGVPLWTNLYNGQANSDDYAQAVAVDGSNNVIVTGFSTGEGGGYDYATIKYSGEGVPLWTNLYNGPENGDDEATAVAVDGSNNVIVTGSSTGSEGSSGYATIEYSSAGIPLWTNLYNGLADGRSEANAVVVDGSNNVIVTGESWGGASSYDYVTIQYSAAGAPLWTNYYNGPGNDWDLANALAVDRSNNVIVTGFSIGDGSSPDYATIKYSSEGVPLWTNRYNGPANNTDFASALALDRNDNVIVTGYSLGSGTAGDYATIKYSSAGIPLWTNRYNGPGNSADAAGAVAVDGNNNVIVTGRSVDSGGNYDAATVKYVSATPTPLITIFNQTNGTMQIRVDDVMQPGTLVIEASTNLTGWVPVFTNTTPTNVLLYTDPNAGNSPTRLYRALQFP